MRGDGFVLPSAAPCAGRVWWTAVFSWLDQIHRSVPLRITSDSPRLPTRASRCCFCPPYQTRQVCVPVIVEPSDDEPPPRPPEGREVRQAEVGGLHHGAGDIGQLGLLHVDEELGGAALRQARAGTGGVVADERRRAHDGNGGGRRGPARPGVVGEEAHGLIVAAGG